jgi:hypothetical protein
MLLRCGLIRRTVLSSHAQPTGKATKPMVVAMVLENIWAVYDVDRVF